MTEDDPKPTKEVLDWTKIDKLNGTRLGALISDLQELTEQQDDINTRVEALRVLIAPLVQNITCGIRVMQSRIDWFPAKESQGAVEESRLVSMLGLTKEEIDKCRGKAKMKKAYFRISRVESSSSLTPEDGSLEKLGKKS